MLLWSAMTKRNQRTTASLCQLLYLTSLPVNSWLIVSRLGSGDTWVPSAAAAHHRGYHGDVELKDMHIPSPRVLPCGVYGTGLACLCWPRTRVVMDMGLNGPTLEEIKHYL